MFFFVLFPRHSDFGCASLNPIKLFICMVVVILFIRKGFSPSFFTSLAFVPFQFIHCKSCSTISWKTKRSIWLKLSLLVIDASLITLASMTKRISRQLHVQSKWFHFSTRFGSVFASHFSVLKTLWWNYLLDFAEHFMWIGMLNVKLKLGAECFSTS